MQQGCGIKAKAMTKKSNFILKDTQGPRTIANISGTKHNK